MMCSPAAKFMINNVLTSRLMAANGLGMLAHQLQTPLWTHFTGEIGKNKTAILLCFEKNLVI